MTRHLSTDILLPDIVNADIRVLFVNSAITPASERAGHYYADSGDDFYQLLHSAGFTRKTLTPEKDKNLIQDGIGLTSLSKTRAVSVPGNLLQSDYSIGRLIRLVFECQPDVVCLNGKIPYRQFFDLPPKCGIQKETIGNARIFVVPDSNRSLSGESYETTLEYYQQCHQFSAELAVQGSGL